MGVSKRVSAVAGGRARDVTRVRRIPRAILAASVATVTLGAIVAFPAGSSADQAFHRDRNEFHQTNLVSNLPTVGAKLVDPLLKNPWGLAATPTSPIWAADNNADVATVYPGGVKGSPIINALTVSIPDGAPTGQVFNPTPGFVVSGGGGSGPALFIFSSENGDITAWNPGVPPTVPPPSKAAQPEFHSATAVYKGLAIASTLDGAFLYASNFHDGTVDVFNSVFQKVTSPGGFSDPYLPRGYAPFGIQNIHGLIYVTYALQDDAKHDDVKGRGHGFIDVYTTDGFLVDRLASRGTLDSPWGMTIAPPNFGRFAGELLVGNFGDGRVNVFESLGGGFLGQLRGESGRAIVIDGLWGLHVGNAATGGPKSVLFSAGLNDEQDGLLGTLTPAA